MTTACIVETWWLYGPRPSLSHVETIAVQLHALCYLNKESHGPEADHDSLCAQKHWLAIANLRELEKGGAICWSRATQFCFEFCSHRWRPESYDQFRNMISTSFWPMLRYKSASIVETSCATHVDLPSENWPGTDTAPPTSLSAGPMGWRSCCRCCSAACA